MLRTMWNLAQVDADIGQGGEGLNLDLRTQFSHRLADLDHLIVAGARAQLVGLGQQQHHRQLTVRTPLQHVHVGLFERVANVHQDDQPLQGLPALQIFRQGFLPLELHFQRDLRITVAWQVDQTLARFEFKQVDQLGATRCLTGTRQVLVLGQGIQCRGFARVGAPGKRNLDTPIMWQVADVGCAGHKMHLIEIQSLCIQRKFPIEREGYRVTFL